LIEKQEFELPVDLTISNLSTFKSDVTDLIEKSDDITFMDKSLNKIDTVGVQLLLVVINEIITRKKTFTWQINSETLKESIKQLGLENSDFKIYLQIN
jgi:ABC-type transporter Mla MlaB component